MNDYENNTSLGTSLLPKTSKPYFQFPNDKQYREFVAKALSARLSHEQIEEWLDVNGEKVVAVYELDFDPISEKIRGLYSENPKNKPCDPQVIIRSLLLMIAFGITSITAWSKKIKSEPILAIFCGIEPDKSPAVGTYYELFKRLENGPFRSKCPHRILESEQRQAKQRDCIHTPQEKPDNKPEYQEAEHGQVMKNYIEEVKSRENQKIPEDLEKRLNEILMEVAVKPSVINELLDLSKPKIAGDGSTIPSYSDPNGKPLCECRKKGIWHCEHLHKYSDPDSQWGWDNRVKGFVYGYRYFQFTAIDNNEHNLPVYVNMDSANAYEPKMAVKAIDRMTKSGIKIDTACFDSLFDSYAFYHYLIHKQILYAIPYAKQPAKCIKLGQEDMLFNSDGQPLCAGGLPMLRHREDDQGRRLYHCPIKRTTHLDGKPVRVTRIEECPRASLCEPDSKMGPIVYVAPDIDYRVHPPIDRNSKKYKDLCNARSACERSNAMKKDTYSLKRAKMRVLSYAFIRVVFASILEHSKIWAREAIKNCKENGKKIASLFI